MAAWISANCSSYIYALNIFKALFIHNFYHAVSHNLIQIYKQEFQGWRENEKQTIINKSYKVQ